MKHLMRKKSQGSRGFFKQHLESRILYGAEVAGKHFTRRRPGICIAGGNYKSWAEIRADVRRAGSESRHFNSIVCAELALHGSDASGPTETGTSPVVSDGMEASEPMNSSGHGGLMSTPGKEAFPASASSRFRDITSGPPPGEVTDETQHLGTLDTGWDRCSIQPTRSKTLSGPCGASLPPWLMESGRTNPGGPAGTWRNAAVLGAQEHLWQLPV